MLPYILIGVIALIVVFLLVVAMQPSTFRVERTASITAPPPPVFSKVNDMHCWEEWSPWAKIDPNAKITFEGPRAGTGAAYAWSGNNKVGAGRMTITDSRPNEFVQFRLEFLRPFKATHTAEFAFKSAADQTSVTWSMFGKNNFMSKAFGLFVNCDKMVGKDFEKGLASLKSLSESSIAKVAA